MIELSECKLCPVGCKINRNEGKIGKCKAGAKVKIARAGLHFFEEPCISGEKGSGTVFFTGCNLNCIYCQNYKVSQEYLGKEIEIEDLAKEFLRLEEEGANNINLVTGFMFVPHIIKALDIAKKEGLNIPVVYNSSGYESIDTLKMLEGYVDIYLPDLKYYFDDLAFNMSGINNYFEVATKAIKEMYRQVGAPKFNEDGLIKKGLIIRHLVLPNHILNSKNVLKWISKNIDKNVYISIMGQYFPTYKAVDTDDINRKLTAEEYEKVKGYIEEFDIENGYFQELEENEEKYVHKFDEE
jgi:putative pyruvate formate lyase activating enzyme